MVLIEAKVVDPTHLELSTAITVGRGRRVIVAVAESGESDSERRQRAEGSTCGLQAAYGDSEPEYTRAMIRESNPAYGA
jgi:hypothetical protein